MYEDEAIKNKKDIVLDLSDTEATAKICKALSSETRLEILKCLVDKSMTISELAEAFYLPMSSMCLHIKTLSEANLITVVPKPGLRGSQKLCGIKTANVTLDIFAHPSMSICRSVTTATVTSSLPAESPLQLPMYIMRTAPTAFIPPTAPMLP